MVVNHKDFNPANNSLDNLEWVTSRENILHAYTKEDRKIGPLQDYVMEIVEKYKKGGVSYNDLAKEYSSSVTAICQLIKGQTYLRLREDFKNESFC